MSIAHRKAWPGIAARQRLDLGGPCPPGASHCPPGTEVEVFDVSDPQAPVKAGSYDGEASPAVHLRLERDLGVARSSSGLRVFTLEAAP